ncbi:hypothetical protein [Thalassomonas actiniarum]|uniref:Uncharacterized protein n=1 Tax=Thalassomonas actiniarum TaxID=485447 RepID=A0AAE9YVQ0_9GAMM|nr:hypothetical protein [Thalassomonas actiniarum]WDE02140.1 hypothetical protein SG35_030745 [Thalassomonas actiniarum]
MSDEKNGVDKVQNASSFHINKLRFLVELFLALMATYLAFEMNSITTKFNKEMLERDRNQQFQYTAEYYVETLGMIYEYAQSGKEIVNSKEKYRERLNQKLTRFKAAAFLYEGSFCKDKKLSEAITKLNKNAGFSKGNKETAEAHYREILSNNMEPMQKLIISYMQGNC